MNNMTQEEKAKRYDEVIKKAESLYKAAEPMSGCNVIIETLFPELKESEDERIRKELIQRIKYDGNGQYNYNKKDYIAWLEKQGEQKPVREHDFLKISSESYSLSFINYLDAHLYEGKMCVSNGECEDIENAFRNADWGKIGRYYNKFTQKPTDNVEPKFKVGDWVVCNNGSHHIFQVIEHSWPNAKYRNINGTEIFLNINTLYKQYHLWTIQDAKDGDILTHSDKNRFKHDWIGIFKEYNNSNDSVSTYCYMPHDNAKFYINEDIIDSKNLKPATKEQRDLLLQKMKEAGYEWDTEKKELKKIEQKNEINIPFIEIPFGAKDSEFLGANYYIPEGFHAEIKGNRVFIKKGEKKPAWSEEDARLLDNCISLIEDIDCTKEEQDWLKGIKDRVQPKQEWSEEDERIYKSITYSFANNYPLSIQQQEFVKSLRSQTTWKPSDEQIKAVKEAACYSSIFSEKTIDNLILLSKQLKKLREE